MSYLTRRSIIENCQFFIFPEIHSTIPENDEEKNGQVICSSTHSFGVSFLAYLRLGFLRTDPHEIALAFG